MCSNKDIYMHILRGSTVASTPSPPAPATLPVLTAAVVSTPVAVLHVSIIEVVAVLPVHLLAVLLPLCAITQMPRRPCTTPMLLLLPAVAMIASVSVPTITISPLPAVLPVDLRSWPASKPYLPVSHISGR